MTQANAYALLAGFLAGYVIMHDVQPRFGWGWAAAAFLAWGIVAQLIEVYAA